MVHDSVREELALKISPIKTVKPVIEEKPVLSTPPVIAAPRNIPIVPKDNIRQNIEKPVTPIPPKNPPTLPNLNKATSPTLVGFQNKNTTLPDWRLQLQNSVRKRLDEQKSEGLVDAVMPSAPRLVNLVNGATALNPQIIEEVIPVPPSNSTVKNALKRIEESRRKYLLNETAPAPVEQTHVEQSTVKQFPTVLPNRPQEFLPKQSENTVNNSFSKPNIVQFSSETKVSNEVKITGETKIEKFDTNKLPPLPLPAKISSSFEKRPVEPKKIYLDFSDDDLLEIHTTNISEVMAYNDSEAINIEASDSIEEFEEMDDYAPIPLRFNAALFDLLICSFLSLLLLSPFMLLNGKFFSIEGFFAFLATSAIVMFIYLTTTIALLGRTFGMRIFSLEIIDIEENDYPTLHQAAVSSSVYLLSLIFVGIGFLPMLLNREKRAAHDLLSRTIIIREE